MTLGLRSRLPMAVACGAAVLAFAAGGCTPASTTHAGTGNAGAKIKGGTAVWALPPSSAPNYIFPFESSAYLSTYNSLSFAQLMYRPLYWFGAGAQPLLNPSLSLASPPAWSGNTATITLKHYMWSNGSPVTTADVMFWINMLKDPKVGPIGYGAYNGFPNAFVRSIRALSPTKLQLTTKRAYSHAWFLYNDLSQITPMPAAWDRTASGPSACATKVTDCTAVYRYLDARSRQLTTYASAPMWGIVDGPWKLSAFSADGHATFVPNTRYSGPVKPALAKFEEVPFTSDAAEYRALRSPRPGGQKIDVGYLPLADAPAKPAGSSLMSPGTNPLPGYTLRPLYLWGINYFVMNFQSSTGNGAVIRQLYFRQALAHLLDQRAVIEGPLHGYGTPTVGPVGNTPVTKFLSPLLRSGNPFPFDPAKARSLLTSHGWKVVPKQAAICVAPARCGRGISSGHRLVFDLPYVAGTGWIAQEMQQFRASALLAGIRINLRPEPFGQIAALSVGNCKVARLPCNWDLANWGSGWLFGPDFAPTGETLFKCGAIANSGGYCSPRNDALIDKTLTSDNLSFMYQWQDFLARQLPVMFQPNGVYQLTEIVSNLKGVTPQSPTLSINPEDWYFVK
jgi:peptide/nickel transport system substrate-binding protein